MTSPKPLPSEAGRETRDCPRCGFIHIPPEVAEAISIHFDNIDPQPPTPEPLEGVETIYDVVEQLIYYPYSGRSDKQNSEAVERGVAQLKSLSLKRVIAELEDIPTVPLYLFGAKKGVRVHLSEGETKAINQAKWIRDRLATLKAELEGLDDTTKSKQLFS